MGIEMHSLFFFILNECLNRNYKQICAPALPFIACKQGKLCYIMMTYLFVSVIMLNFYSLVSFKIKGLEYDVSMLAICSKIMSQHYLTSQILIACKMAYF